MTSSKEVHILLDADVIIHLFKADKISLLNELFPGRLIILDIVLNELLGNRTVNRIVENLITFKQVVVKMLPTTSNPALFKEFIALKKQIEGPGERACLIFCKHYPNIIASSNTKDILPFCKEHSIAYITTLDIFSIAIDRGKITKKETNDFIKKITFNDGSHLCCKTIEEHLERHFDISKLLY